MTPAPRFDDLVGGDLSPTERERLGRVHDLLVAAGPPPELSPGVALGPDPRRMRIARKRRVQQRVLLLAAALCVLALAYLAGFLSGYHQNHVSGRVLQLHGTAAAPGALASLVIEPVDAAGNWPMRLSATGLPKLPTHGYYAVYLTRDGKPLLPCGTFVVRSTHGSVSVTLNAPYHLRKGDGWVVTKELPGRPGAGPIVMRPLT